MAGGGAGANGGGQMMGDGRGESDSFPSPPCTIPLFPPPSSHRVLALGPEQPDVADLDLPREGGGGGREREGNDDGEGRREERERREKEREGEREAEGECQSHVRAGDSSRSSRPLVILGPGSAARERGPFAGHRAGPGTWPHVLGQPVQWMRTSAGRSNLASSSSANLRGGAPEGPGGGGGRTRRCGRRDGGRPTADGAGAACMIASVLGGGGGGGGGVCGGVGGAHLMALPLVLMLAKPQNCAENRAVSRTRAPRGHRRGRGGVGKGVESHWQGGLGGGGGGGKGSE